MTPLRYFTAAIAIAAVPLQAQGLQRLDKEMSHFYLHPTREQYNTLQTHADQCAAALQRQRNRADLYAAVMIAKISEKYHWDIIGKSQIADQAREITNGRSPIATYVRDDRSVDPGKFDIWWVDFYATGETKYLEKILRYAERLHKGQRAAQMVVPFAASWSFKSNCKQQPAVLTYAKDCLKTNRFPQKKDFLQECVHYAEKP